jgi:hypothetical protein
MPAYQLFFITGEDKAVRKLEQNYDDDSAALHDARELAVTHTIYIWQDTRRVATIAPDGNPQISPIIDRDTDAFVKRAGG